MFVPGVVVPLITTLGVNGKVTFVEKHGTGAANSTGAYELDPSQADNFPGAWRTMKGLKTDVFCSAGLTLPDKVGRQINIGGWSGTSLVSLTNVTQANHRVLSLKILLKERNPQEDPLR